MGFGIPQLSRRNRERLRGWRESVVNFFLIPWYAITGAFSWVGRTIAKAWGTRHLRYLLQGLPAVFAVSGVLVLGVAAAAQNKPNLAQDYKLETEKALRNRDFSLARTNIEKAIALDGAKDEYRFYLLLALEGEARGTPTRRAEPEKFKHCLAIAQKLAPNDANGYGPAHLWLGSFIMQSFSLTPETIKFVENHLTRAYQIARVREPDGFDAKMAAQKLGFLLANTGRDREAEPYLKKIADDVPLLKLRLAQIYLATDRPEEARLMLESAIAYFSKKAEDNLDDHPSRFAWVEALVLQKKFGEAMDVLQKGDTTSPNNPRFKMSIAAVDFDWDTYLASKPGTTLEQRFALIQHGLRAFSAHRGLLGRLIEISRQTGPEGEKSKKLMEDLLANSPTAAPILHLFLGNRYYTEKRIQEAKYHWDQAYRLDPSFGEVINNLAWMQSQEKDADLQKCLDMINQALEKQKVPQFRGTRGEILFKMGRFQEALEDLQEGVKASPDNANLHEMLGETYKKLGNLAMAELHRKKAEELKLKAKKPEFPDLPPAGTPAKPPESKAEEPTGLQIAKPAESPPKPDAPASKSPPK